MRKIKTHITLAGISIDCSFQHESTALNFNQFLRNSGEEAQCVVELNAEKLQRARVLYPEDFSEELVEYNELVNYISEELLRYQRCIFHGVSFLWRGKAYIFTAPSGTGKTTQYVLWKLLLGDEIQVLNGDKPILSWEDNGEIWVHPSPWTGKERIGTMRSAPLAGIILLEQGADNQVERLSTQQAVLQIFCQFLFAGETGWSVRKVAQLEEELLKRIPVWKFINRGDYDSAKVCSDLIRRSQEESL